MVTSYRQLRCTILKRTHGARFHPWLIRGVAIRALFYRAGTSWFSVATKTVPTTKYDADAPIGEVFDQTKGMWVPIATTGLDPQTLPEAEAVRVPGGLILAGGLRDIDDIDVNNQPNNDIFPGSSDNPHPLAWNHNVYKLIEG